MPNYTDQFPAALQAGDTVTLTTAGTYHLPPNLTCIITLNGAKGGAGGGLTYYFGQHLTPGGEGGDGASITAALALLDSLTYVKGTPGYAGRTEPEPGSYSSGWSASGGRGSAASAASISDSRGSLLTAGGGYAGGYANAYCAAPGESVRRYPGTKGTNGIGTAIDTAVDVSTSTSNANNAVFTIVSRNQPPSAPASIDYGTPRAGKPITITLTPATDPD